METVPLGSLEDGATFRCPWRSEDRCYGRVERVGVGSVYVHVANQEGTGWEYSNWSLGTSVVPCDEKHYHIQGFGKTGTGRVMNRSETEKPVETVHRICEEMRGSQRKDIIRACVEAGVNVNTAKTQFYHWKKQNT